MITMVHRGASAMKAGRIEFFVLCPVDETVIAAGRDWGRRRERMRKSKNAE